MASAAQIFANRQNSKLSTGPKSETGKSTSKLNATRHGLSAAAPVLPHEDPQEFHALLDDCRNEFNPATPHQNFLVDLIAGARWKLRRLDRIETELLTLIAKQEDETSDAKIAEALLNKDHANAYARLERHRLNLERSYHRAIKELSVARKEQNEAKREKAEKTEDLEAVLIAAQRRARWLQKYCAPSEGGISVQSPSETPVHRDNGASEPPSIWIERP